MSQHQQYQVIARKWRPQSFGDLIGQDHISTTLLNALRGDRLPQALLFTGVRGTGKTSSARILAKSLRCANAVDFVPCGKCRDCEDIALSRSVDVVEIDGASNNGVDAIRELRDSVAYMPTSGKYKIYIIDEVHMLSTAAFNALLKTLEEPPAHVVFVLATTEVQKIPNTILSRCQRFDFRRIPSRVIAGQLTKICEAEGVQSTADAVWAIARQADGSMRDGQSLLDHVITFSNKEITLPKVIEVLGLTDRTLVTQGAEALIRRDPSKALHLIDSIARSGVDPKLFAQDLLEEMRNALMVRLSPEEPARVVDLPDSEIAELSRLAQSTTEEDLHALFDMLLKGINDLLRSSDPKLVLEMTLLRISSAPTMVNLRELLGRAVPAPTPAPTPTPKTPTVVSGPTTTPATPPTVTTETRYTVESFTRPAKPGGPTGASPKTKPPTALPQTAAPSEPPPSESNGTPSDMADHDAASIDPTDPWMAFVYRVRKSNGLLGAMLENTHILEQSAERLVVGVPKKVSFMIDKIRDPENVKRVEQFIETFWEKRLKVEIKMAEGSADQLTPKAKEDRAKVRQTQSIASSVEDDALVRSAKNIFKTQVKAIREAGPSQSNQTKESK